MIVQCALRVTCRIDGKIRTFFFSAAKTSDGSLTPGLCHGCSAKSACVDCIRCWRDVKAEVFARNRQNQN